MFHWIRFRAFVYATEDREKVIKAMKNAGSCGDIRSNIAEGAYGDRIEILEARMKKKSEIDGIMSKIGKRGMEKILENLDDRVDEEGILHFRLDKQKAYLGEIEISRGGDVIAVEMKIETYPFSRERAIKIAREYMEEFL